MFATVRLVLRYLFGLRFEEEVAADIAAARIIMTTKTPATIATIWPESPSRSGDRVLARLFPAVAGRLVDLPFFAAIIFLSIFIFTAIVSTACHVYGRRTQPPTIPGRIILLWIQ